MKNLKHTPKNVTHLTENNTFSLPSAVDQMYSKDNVKHLFCIINRTWMFRLPKIYCVSYLQTARSAWIVPLLGSRQNDFDPHATVDLTYYLMLSATRQGAYYNGTFSLNIHHIIIILLYISQLFLSEVVKKYGITRAAAFLC